VELEAGGEPVALIGPNGSGKTTLLRTIAGAHRPASGTIRVGERLVFDSATGVDLPPERRHIGYVPQGYGLLPHLDVVDNVAFGWIGHGAERDAVERRGAAVELLESMGSGHLVGRTPAELSGGEQQRVALARALTVHPEILLLDEPLAALDARARRDVRRFLADHLHRHSTPGIVVSHDAGDVAAVGGEIVVLESGRVVQRGTAEELHAEPATDFVAAFFDLARDGSPRPAPLARGSASEQSPGS